MAKTDLTIPVQVNEARSIVLATDVVDIEINGYDAKDAADILALVFREARGETKPTYTWTPSTGPNTNPLTIPYIPQPPIPDTWVAFDSAFETPVRLQLDEADAPSLPEPAKAYRHSFENGTYTREEVRDKLLADGDYLEFADDDDCCQNPENCVNAACGI